MSRKTHKTRKTRNKSKKTNLIINENTDAKNGTQLKCMMKTCRAKQYKSIFGSVGGSTRSNRQLFY